jgi:hypothetical protein
MHLSCAGAFQMDSGSLTEHQACCEQHSAGPHGVPGGYTPSTHLTLCCAGFLASTSMSLPFTTAGTRPLSPQHMWWCSYARAPAAAQTRGLRSPEAQPSPSRRLPRRRDPSFPAASAYPAHHSAPAYASFSLRDLIIIESRLTKTSAFVRGAGLRVHAPRGQFESSLLFSPLYTHRVRAPRAHTPTSTSPFTASCSPPLADSAGGGGGSPRVE